MAHDEQRQRAKQPPTRPVVQRSAHLSLEGNELAHFVQTSLPVAGAARGAGPPQGIELSPWPANEQEIAPRHQQTQRAYGHRGDLETTPPSQLCRPSRRT
jgi:hypothetical protein